MEGIQTFKGSWPWPWIRPYGIPSCITHRPLPIYQISFKSKKLFVDGRTYGRTYGHFSPSNIIRSTFGSRPKKEVKHKNRSIHRARTQCMSFSIHSRSIVFILLHCIRASYSLFQCHQTPWPLTSICLWCCQSYGHCHIQNYLHNWVNYIITFVVTRCQFWAE